MLGFKKNHSRDPSYSPYFNSMPVQADVYFAKLAWLNFRKLVREEYYQYLRSKCVTQCETMTDTKGKSFKDLKAEAEQRAADTVDSLSSNATDAMKEVNIAGPRSYVQSCDGIKVATAAILFCEPTGCQRPSPQEMHMDR